MFAEENKPNTFQLYWMVLMVLGLPFYASAQEAVYKGKLLHCNTNAAVSFAHIFSKTAQLIAITDIDGRFQLDAMPGDSVLFSALGYQNKWVQLNTSGQLLYCLSDTAIGLSEVVITAGENPAFRIVRNVQEKAEKHHPKNLESYQYTTYDRFVAGFDTNTVLHPEMAAFARKRELMVMETASEKFFKAPDFTHERVIASQISGFKDPVLFFLMSQWQPTDFYSASIQIAGDFYVNPISRGSLSRYNFVLETAFPDANGDSLFMLRFFPKPNTNFKGLTGTMQVHGGDWAIISVSATTDRNQQGISTQIQQLYEKIDNHWFPKQIQSRLFIYNAAPGGLHLQGFGTSYLKDIRINEAIDPKVFRSANLNVAAGANQYDEKFWASERVDSLNPRLMETYRFMDSLGQKSQLDLLLKMSVSIMQSRFPLGKLDILLPELLVFNDFEGFKPGIGLQTNHHLSNHFSFTVSTGFASRVSRWTYRLGLQVPLDRNSNFIAKLDYVNDHFATGASAIPEPASGWFSPSSYRQYFINRMDFHKGFSGSISWHLHPRWQLNIGGKSMHINPLTTITEPKEAIPVSNFIETSEMQFLLRYAVGEQQMLQHRQRVVITPPDFSISASFTGGQLTNPFSEKYQKLEIKAQKSWRWNYAGITTLRVEAAHSTGHLPYPLLFNLPASFRTVTVFAPFSFGTMRMNEFVADRHVMLFWMHDFTSLLFKKGRFAPELLLVSNIAFGSLQSQTPLYTVPLVAPEKGYFESGLLVGNLIKLPLFKLGVGFFHRYGAYRLQKTADNIAVKLVINASL